MIRGINRGGSTGGPGISVSQSPLVVVALFMLVFLTSEVRAATLLRNSANTGRTAAVVGETILQNGVPLNTSLPAYIYANAYIDVPAGATSLTVTITKGTGDLDLYLKYGAPLTGTTIAELNSNADFRSDSSGPNETITVTTNSTPPLKAGKWYVATLNLNSVTTTFTLTATYQVSDGSTQPVPSVPGKISNPVSEGTLTPMPDPPGNKETKHTLKLSADPASGIPGASMNLDYDITLGTAAGDVDLYFGIKFPDGSVRYLGSKGPNDPLPAFKKAIDPTSPSRNVLLHDFTLPDWLPSGTYIGGSALVRAGNDPLDRANWVSNLATTKLYFSSLSPSQQAMLTNYGRPASFIKTFDTDGGSLRLDESWRYPGIWIASFTNGVFVGITADSGPAEAATGYNSEDFTFKNTPQGITDRFGQPQQVTATYDIGSLSGLIPMNKFYIYNKIVFGFQDNTLRLILTTP
jgi:hypothetical protein